MGTNSAQITSLTIVYSTVYSGADQRKHQWETGEFPTQMASNAENVSIWWRHHEYRYSHYKNKTVVRPFYFYIGNSYTDKMTSLYLIGPKTLSS